VFGGLRKNKFLRRLGKPAAIAGVALAIFSGPIQDQFPAIAGPIDPPSPFDLVKAGAQIMKEREAIRKAIEGDQDELKSSGARILDLRNQIVQPWSIDDESQPWLQIPPDFGALEAEATPVGDYEDSQVVTDVDPADLVGDPTFTLQVSADGSGEFVTEAESDPAAAAAGAPAEPDEQTPTVADEPGAERRGDATGEHPVEAVEMDSGAEMAASLREQWRSRELHRKLQAAPEADTTGAPGPSTQRGGEPVAAPPSAAQPRLMPPMPRKPEPAPVAPRKLGAMPTAAPKRRMAPAPVPLAAPKPEMAALPVPLAAPRSEMAALPIPIPLAAKPAPASEPETGRATEPESGQIPESGSEPVASPSAAPEAEPVADAAPKRALRPWLADQSESAPVAPEPER
jgi:hypothetical protein